MRLTVEEHREAIRRYGHIRPGRAWGAGLCSTPCPGSARTCTLARGHRGPHVAHDVLKRVVAVWDGGAEVGPSRENRRTSPRRRPGEEVWTGGVPGAVGALWSRFVRALFSVEEMALLALLIGFIVFAVRWFLEIYT